MTRIKERPQFIYKSNTHEILSCLSTIPSWCQLLLEHKAKSEYQPFLRNLLEAKFFEDKDEKITIKYLASVYNLKSISVTKWIHNIYNDLLYLNDEKPA